MEKSEERARAALRIRLLRALDMESEELLGGWSVMMHGRDGLTLYGRGKILQYTEEEIRLRLRDCVMAVSGEQLCCSAYRTDEVRIEGRIASVVLEEA